MYQNNLTLSKTMTAYLFSCDWPYWKFMDTVKKFYFFTHLFYFLIWTCFVLSKFNVSSIPACLWCFYFAYINLNIVSSFICINILLYSLISLPYWSDQHPKEISLLLVFKNDHMGQMKIVFSLLQMEEVLIYQVQTLILSLVMNITNGFEFYLFFNFKW